MPALSDYIDHPTFGTRDREARGSRAANQASGISGTAKATVNKAMENRGLDSAPEHSSPNIANHDEARIPPFVLPRQRCSAFSSRLLRQRCLPIIALLALGLVTGGMSISA